MNLQRFFDDYYIPNHLLGCSPFTVKAYQLAISTAKKAKNVGKKRCHEVQLKELSKPFLAKMVAYMRGEKLAAATINNRMAHLRCLWRDAKREGLVVDDPPLTRVPEPKLFKQAWTVEEVSALMRSAQSEIGYIGSIPAAKWWTCLILVIYDTGCRKRVIMHTPITNIFWEHQLLLLPGDWQKQRADQYCALSAQSIDALKEIQNPDRTILFPWPFDTTDTTSYPALDYHFKQIVVRAGLDTRNGLFHRLRRTRASYGEKFSPGSAQKDLGHSDPKVTQRYLDPRIVGTSRTVDLIPRPHL